MSDDEVRPSQGVVVDALRASLVQKCSLSNGFTNMRRKIFFSGDSSKTENNVLPMFLDM